MSPGKTIQDHRKRLLFEFEDLPWFPSTIRESMTDYLRYFLTATDFYGPVIPFIEEGLAQTGRNTLVDLCSGSGGAIRKIEQGINERSGKTVTIVLTDKFPNPDAYEFLKRKSEGRILYRDIPVDATDVPAGLEGFRTIFSGFHHFDRETAKAVLRNAVDSNEGIAIFDGGDRNILTILGIIFFHPVAFFLLTPFFRPYRISRLIFTYLIPLIPLCTVWDGVVSILRLYRPAELLKLAEEADNGKYQWRSGKVRNRFGMSISYLIGYPERGNP